MLRPSPTLARKDFGSNAGLDLLATGRCPSPGSDLAGSRLRGKIRILPEGRAHASSPDPAGRAAHTSSVWMAVARTAAKFIAFCRVGGHRGMAKQPDTAVTPSAFS